MSGARNSTAQDTQYVNDPWWGPDCRDDDPGRRMCTLIEQIETHEATLLSNTERQLAVYQYGSAHDIGGKAFGEAPIDESRLTANWAQNTIDTIWARIIKQQIIPMSLTTGGTYVERQRAKEMSQGLEGELAENDFEGIKELFIKDALATNHGAGATYTYNDGRKVQIEHVPIEEVHFDPAEIRYGKPRSCFRTMTIDRFVALAYYGKDKPEFYGDPEVRRQAILSAPRAQKHEAIDSYLTNHDQIEIEYGWHLPSEAGDELEQTDGEKNERETCDGLFCVAVKGEGNHTLQASAWERDHFPILLYVPRKRPRSVWGMSTMFELIPQQREYETVTSRIQRANKAVGLAMFYAQRQSNVDYRELTNGVGGCVEGDSPTPPVPMPIPMVPAELYQYRDSIPRDMRNSKGVSDFAAAGQLPAGLRQASGVALNAWIDEDSEHLIPEYRALERFIVEQSWLIVEEWRALTANNKSYSVRYQAKNKYLRKIAVKDILMDRETCVIKVFPVSALSKNPAQKLDQVTAYLTAGLISVEQAKRLYPFPDLEADNEIEMADIDVVDSILDAMVTSGKYISPQGFDNLQVALQRTGKYINMMRKNNVLAMRELGDGYLPEDRMKLLHDFALDIEAKIEEQKAATAPPPGPVPGSEMGALPPDMPPDGAPLDMGMPAPPMAA